MSKKNVVIALVAFILALIICAGLALAAAVTQRVVNVDYYDPSQVSVSPELAQPLSVPYGSSNSLEYTVSNVTPATQNFTPTASGMPSGVTVSFAPASFSLVSGASQIVMVTIACTGTPADSPITLNFTPI